METKDELKIEGAYCDSCGWQKVKEIQVRIVWYELECGHYVERRQWRPKE